MTSGEIILRTLNGFFPIITLLIGYYIGYRMAQDDFYE